MEHCIASPLRPHRWGSRVAVSEWSYQPDRLPSPCRIRARDLVAGRPESRRRRRRDGPGSGAEEPRAHRLVRGDRRPRLREPALRRLRPHRRPHRRGRARPPPLLLRRHPAHRQPGGVPPQRRHGDARRPARVGRVLLQRSRDERCLGRTQPLLRRRGQYRGRNRG